MQLNLVPHPATPTGIRDFKVWASVDHAGAFGAMATTNIWFGVGAPASKFVIPEAEEPSRADELWKATCFEAFLRESGAEAYQEWNQAAVVDKLITGMPEVVRALAEPLSRVDRITVVSTGGDGAAGMNKITGDLTQIAAQVPPLFETLSGMKMKDVLGKVRPIGDKAATSKAAGTE